MTPHRAGAEDARWLWNELEAIVPDAARDLEPPHEATEGRVSWRGVTPDGCRLWAPSMTRMQSRPHWMPASARAPTPASALQLGLWVTAGHGS